jgi:hypothetical protein
MSILLGPLSETISNVSWRDCAFAGDQIAGAETAPPAATAVTDFRKSRRFIFGSPVQADAAGETAKVVPDAEWLVVALYGFESTAKSSNGRKLTRVP